MPAGRPTTYTKEIADIICEGIADGKSVRTICTPDHMPALSTMYLWLREHEEFSEQYARAKDDQADAMIEDMLAIADNEEGDAARDRLRVDTRKWAASKLKPKKYGDRIENVHSGNLGLTDMKEEKLDDKIRQLESLLNQSEAD